MDILKMTRKEFEALPYRDKNKSIVFDSLVILPGKAGDLHESGYRLMDFVAVIGNRPQCRLSGCSDIIRINGIRGHKEETYSISPSWSIDCLPKSGLLHIWPGPYKMTCGPALPDFEIYCTTEEDNHNEAN